MVQLSHPYMTTGKTIALTRQIFVGKVMSLLFNMLSRLLLGRKAMTNLNSVLNAEAETPILWPPDVKSQLTGKDDDAGKD